MSSTTANHHHSGAGPLSLMSCVRESSPLQDYDTTPDSEKHVPTNKRRFWKKGLRWFRRKKVVEDVPPPEDETPRSRSTSELSIPEENTSSKRRSGTPMNPGLSVSHDSVFHSPPSGSDSDLDGANSSSSLGIPQHTQADKLLQTELSERLRLRRKKGGGREDTSEDDEGLPRSPCNSPTTAPIETPENEKTALKDLPVKSHSICSDGSLISMTSLEVDDEILIHNCSTKIASVERKNNEQEHEFEVDGPFSSPLNHAAAHHKVAVRPKRTHGAPRRKRAQQLTNALPTTLEVNEDLRGISPENISKKVPPNDTKLLRSQSNAGSKSHDTLDSEHHEKEERSFLDRIFPIRKSAKKKKEKLKEYISNISTKETMNFEDKQFDYLSKQSYTRSETVTSSSYKKSDVRLSVPKSGPSYRQRVVPRDIPDSPEVMKKELTPLSVSPKIGLRFDKVTSKPPLSPTTNIDPVPAFSSKDYLRSSTTYFDGVKSEETTKHRVTLPGLSSLQQKALLINEDKEYGFQSLTEFTSVKNVSNIVKSQSFKSVDKTNYSVVPKFDLDKSKINKAASFDSLKVEGDTLPSHAAEKEFLSLENNVDDVEKKIDAILSSDANLSSFYEQTYPGSITISGPSHTAIVNIGGSLDLLHNEIKCENTNRLIEIKEAESKAEELVVETKTEQHKEIQKEKEISVTKVCLNKQSPTSEVPEFLQKHLNKIEAKSPTNVVFARNNSPAVDDSKVFKFDVEKPRKFSKEEVEIVEKAPEEEVFVPPKLTGKLVGTPTMFIKNSFRKSSVISITPDSPTFDKSLTKSSSTSLDSVRSDLLDSTDKSSQDSLMEKSDGQSEKPVRRRRSLASKNKKDDEPELMKVFARRSLKLKDSEVEELDKQLSVMYGDNRSDKENVECSPSVPVATESKEEEPAMKIKSKPISIVRDKSKNLPESEKIDKSPPKEDALRNTTNHTEDRPKAPIPIVRDKSKIFENTERSPPNDVNLRNTANNLNQRSVSLKTVESKVIHITQQNMRKSEQWINFKGEKDVQTDLLISNNDIIEFPNVKAEIQNFNQRKAEWEKRAQESQKKSSP